MPAEGVYPCLPARIAATAASWMCAGVAKSGCPMQKEMMSRPWRISAVTSASTTKAFSVPRSAVRRLIAGMGAKSSNAGAVF